MKKLFIILSLVIIFAGCKQAAGTDNTIIKTTDSTFYVKNSVWNNVDLTTLLQYKVVTNARSVDGISDLAEAQKIVAEYNAETNNDQLVILTEDIPIEESPNADIYYAKAVNGLYEIKEHFIVDRSYFAKYRQNYEIDCATLEYVLFVDKVPETVPVVVVVPDTRTRHEKNAIYMVNKYDKIVVDSTGFRYEKHCDEDWDAWHGIDPAFDYKTEEQYFNSVLAAFNSCINGEGTIGPTAPWRVVSGQIYTEPTE